MAEPAVHTTLAVPGRPRAQSTCAALDGRRSPSIRITGALCEGSDDESTLESSYGDALDCSHARPLIATASDATLTMENSEATVASMLSATMTEDDRTLEPALRVTRHARRRSSPREALMLAASMRSMSVSRPNPPVQRSVAAELRGPVAENPALAETSPQWAAPAAALPDPALSDSAVLIADLVSQLEAAAPGRPRRFSDSTGLDQAAAAVISRSPPLTKFRTGLRALIVDDSSAPREVARSILMKYSFHCAVAVNGRQALEMFQSVARANPFDVILMDCEMPELDGCGATREIRAHEALLGLKRTPIIAMTTNTSAEQRAACHAADMDLFLEKPCAKAVLLEALENLLAVEGS